MLSAAPAAITHRFTLDIATERENQILDLTRELSRKIREFPGMGILHLFVTGSTVALTTMEFEHGLVTHDFAAMMEKVAPADGNYDHEATWNDDNGHAHLRASLLGPSLSIPFESGKLLLGEYQQIVLCEFDTRPRRRHVVATILANA
jgi:secondary thiamine-phosphate synthase enzyme